MIQFNLNDKQCEVPEGTTILHAARESGIDIPTLCYHDKLEPYGGCRLCLVEVGVGASPDRMNLLPSCTTKVENGQTVITDSDRVKKARKFVITLLLSRSPESKELQKIAADLGLPMENKESLNLVEDYLLNQAKRTEETNCIRCSLCVRVCMAIPKRFALSLAGRGIARKVTSPFEKVSDTCIGCGSCAYVCPTKTITIEEAS